MSGSGAAARDEAIDWAIRSHEATFDDWEALADWLAADPEHALLYDRATVAAAVGAGTSGGAIAARVVAFPEAAGRRKSWFPLAVAASLVAAVGAGLTVYHRASAPDYYTVATPAGGHQALALAGAVRMELNGDTRITLDRNDPRFARLDQGQATFTVTHDPKHPFVLRVGDTRVTDIGTVFDVERYGAGTRIAVADGAVRVATPARTVAVAAGGVVDVDGGGAVAVRRDQDVQQVGAWRQGQIDFADISLAQLALRLHRASGARIAVAPAVANRRVTGTIMLGGDRDATLHGLGAVLGVAVTGQGNDWTWSARTGAISS